MSKDIPDYMRGFDLNDDWGIAGTAAEAPKTPSIDTSKIASTDELKDLKKDNEETKISKKNNFQKNTRRINSLDEFEKRNNEIPI